MTREEVVEQRILVLLEEIEANKEEIEMMEREIKKLIELKESINNQ